MSLASSHPRSEQSDEMSLTQEFLAQMLGVRRTSVSLVRYAATLGDHPLPTREYNDC